MTDLNHFDVDPDSAFHSDADPDPAFHSDADPDPLTFSQIWNLQCSKMTLTLMLIRILLFTFNVDTEPDPAFHFDADPDRMCCSPQLSIRIMNCG